MSDPQPHHLKPKPERAEPWQPDRPGADAPSTGEADPATSDPTVSPSQAKAVRPSATTATGTGASEGSARSKASPEAQIARDPQNGQALNDPSLDSDDPAGLPDGASNSTRLPESGA